MTKINRYKFAKYNYKDYLILLLCKGKYKSFNVDKKILKIINFKKLDNLNKRQINYIILDNLTIIKKKQFKNNKYYNYYVKARTLMIVDYIKARAYDCNMGQSSKN